jgi:hypothetical protein
LCDGDRLGADLCGEALARVEPDRAAFRQQVLDVVREALDERIARPAECAV